jgi:hypothetical protein
MGEGAVGFGGFIAPRAWSARPAPGATISVRFRLTDATGQSVSPATTAALAGAHQVTATISWPEAACAWLVRIAGTEI